MALSSRSAQSPRTSAGSPAWRSAGVGSGSDNRPRADARRGSAPSARAGERADIGRRGASSGRTASRAAGAFRRRQSMAVAAAHPPARDPARSVRGGDHRPERRRRLRLGAGRAARRGRGSLRGAPPEGQALMDDRPRYMISVAADLVGMHPQTLRIYEAKGLVRPKRTAGNTRLYSEADIERLKLIQRLTTDIGLNLAGVERVLHLEDELQRMRLRLDRMEREMHEAIDQVHRQYRRDLVLYRPAQAPVRREAS